MSLPSDPRQLWEESFEEQIARGAYNTAPVEALVRTIAYHLRARYSAEQLRALHFLEMGCGAGPNLAWLAEKGIRVSGVDIARNALPLARRNLERLGHAGRIGELVEASVTHTPFASASFDGVIEACVFQHLARAERRAAFAEVRRLLKPGGAFVGYMLDAGHTIFQRKRSEQDPTDPGTLQLSEGGSRVYLSNIGLAHFFSREELQRLLEGFAVVDPCLTTYVLPRDEALRRGYDEYVQSMWTVYAVR